MSTRAIVAVLLALVTLVTLGAIATSHTGPRAASLPTVCDPAVVMNHRLDELGRSGYAWEIQPDPIDNEHHAGYTYFDPPLVVVSGKVTCEQMPTVVNHEWMHVQQARAFPGQVVLAYGGMDEVEIIADCGSMLLGSAYTPYLTQRRQQTGDHGCTADENWSARELINHPR